MVYKAVILVMTAMLLVTVVRAQFLGGFFNQKKTQIKYLEEQIAELKVYAGMLHKGYSIAKEGLNTINSIKHGDFDIHAGWFTSLKDVNPAIGNLALVADIMLYQKQLLALCRASQPLLSTAYLGNSTVGAKNGYDGVLAQVSASIDLLALVVTSGKLKMKDDGRIRLLERLDVDLSELYKYARSYQNNTIAIIRQRRAEAGQLDWLHHQYGLP